MTTEVPETKEQQFVLCACYKKPDHFCKQWNGKGDITKVQTEVREVCTSNNINPDTCEFLCTPIKREGCDWVWKTTAGALPEKAIAITLGEELEAEAKSISQLPKKQLAKACAECGEDATHKIEGYKTTYLCGIHAEAATVDGFVTVVISEENNA
jgi:hypothetical protein